MTTGVRKATKRLGLLERELQRLVDEAVACGDFSDVSLAVSSASDWSVVCRAPGQPRDQPLYYDLASLTKPVVASTALRLAEAGVVDLGCRVGDVLSTTSDAGGARREIAQKTLEDLLRHRAGLAAWAPLEVLVGAASSGSGGEDSRNLLLERVLLGSRWQGAPADTYSDLGYMLAGLVLEEQTGHDLAELLTSSLPMVADGEIVIAPAPSRTAVSCSMDGTREVELARDLGIELALPPAPEPGQAQDGNARFLTQWLGGCPGHAGLFGTLAGVLELGRLWTSSGTEADGELGTSTRQSALRGRGVRRLGWWRCPPSWGARLSAAAFGHTGFTGTSLVVEPQQDLVLVMLGHRTSSTVDANLWRRRFHDLVVDGLRF